MITALARTGRGSLAAVLVPAWIGGAYFLTSSTSFANPTVTLARALSDTFAGISPASAPAFIAAQAACAAAGLGLGMFLFPHSVSSSTIAMPETLTLDPSEATHDHR